MITNRELFDRVAKHLREQGKPSLMTAIDHEGEEFVTNNCAYRGAEGTMCAVGCLISDDHYSDCLENKTVLSNGVLEAVRSSLGSDLTTENENLLVELQELHDTLLPAHWGTEGFERHLREIERRFL